MANEIYPVVSPHLYGRMAGKDYYRIYLGTVTGYIRDKASSKIVACLVNENKGAAVDVAVKLSTKSPNEWDTPQVGDKVLWGYMNGDIINPYILCSAYEMFGGQVDEKLFRKVFPSGAVWQVDSSGNMTLTIPGTVAISNTGDSKDISISTTKGNITITANGTGKNITIAHGSNIIKIDSNGNITIDVAGNLDVITGGDILLNGNYGVVVAPGLPPGTPITNVSQLVVAMKTKGN